jgi:hypothetical protein
MPKKYKNLYIGIFMVLIPIVFAFGIAPFISPDYYKFCCYFFYGYITASFL